MKFLTKYVAPALKAIEVCCFFALLFMFIFQSNVESGIWAILIAVLHYAVRQQEQQSRIEKKLERLANRKIETILINSGAFDVAERKSRPKFDWETIV